MATKYIENFDYTKEMTIEIDKTPPNHDLYR